MTTQDAPAIVSVPFHGDALDAFALDGKTWVSLKRICEALGVDMESQRRKLKSKPWACTVISTVQVDGQGRDLTMIDLDTLPMWLATIDVRRVAEESREKLTRYQREAARVLADHFYRRVPASTPPAPAIPPAPIPPVIPVPVFPQRRSSGGGLSVELSNGTEPQRYYGVEERAAQLGYHFTYRERLLIARFTREIAATMLGSPETRMLSTDRVTAFPAEQLKALDAAILGFHSMSQLAKS
jgi:hypothetical protein